MKSKLLFGDIQEDAGVNELGTALKLQFNRGDEGVSKGELS